MRTIRISVIFAISMIFVVSGNLFAQDDPEPIDIYPFSFGFDPNDPSTAFAVPSTGIPFELSGLDITNELHSFDLNLQDDPALEQAIGQSDWDGGTIIDWSIVRSTTLLTDGQQYATFALGDQDLWLPQYGDETGILSLINLDDMSAES